MKTWLLVAACQNQWQENSLLTKNPNFKIEVRTDKKTYQFNWDYINQKNWQKIRDREVIAFRIKKNKLYINACTPTIF